jgi:hypothetical protein
MPKQPRLVHCGFCNKSFQTFEEDKYFCNFTCENKAVLVTSRIPWEQKGGLEGVDPAWEKPFTACQHCGKRWGKDKKYRCQLRRQYCDTNCNIARQIYDGEKAVKKMCRECGKIFVSSPENRVHCNEHNRRSKKAE